MRRTLLLAVLLLALTSCSSTAPELQTTSVDVDRAFTAARDPWAAPTSVVFPSQEYGGANLLRDAGTRSTSYPGIGAARIARLEIDSALAAGWALASVECGDEPTFTAALTRGDSLDNDALAVLGVDDAEASVALHVPHHLDGSWPDTTSVELDDTCLGGGPANEAAPDLPVDPYPGDGASPGPDDFEPWQRDRLSSARQPWSRPSEPSPSSPRPVPRSSSPTSGPGTTGEAVSARQQT